MLPRDRLRSKSSEGAFRYSASALLVLLLVLAPSRRAFAQGHGPTRVEVELVQKRELAPTIRVVGTVRPRLRTTLAAEVAGLVEALPVNEGDLVLSGQLVCKVRDARTRFAHLEAAARLSEYQATLKERTADLGKAEFEKDRTARLYQSGQGSEKEYSDAQADYDASFGRVEQARYSVEAQKAVVATLADDLARMEIRAPCDGSIVAKQTEIGSWVDQGGAVVELVDLSVARVRVAVPEKMINHCRVGESATVEVEALGKEFGGKIARVVPDADERARTFPVEIDIPNAAGELKAGMFVRAAVPSGPKSEQLVVPKDAIVVRGPMSMMFVVRDGENGQMAMPIPVQVISEVLDCVAVHVAGLNPGDLVVVRGNEYMFAPGPVIAIPRPVAGETGTAQQTPEPHLDAPSGEPRNAQAQAESTHHPSGPANPPAGTQPAHGGQM